MMDIHADFDEAKAAAGEGQRLLAVVKDNEVAYVVVRDGLDDEALTEIAFKVKYGRPMSGYEQAARRLHALVAEAMPA